MTISSKIFILISLTTLISCSNNQPAAEAPLANQPDTTIKKTHEAFEIDFPITRFQVEKVITKDSSAGNISINNWILRGAENNDPFIYFVSQNATPEQLQIQIEKDSNLIYVAFQTGLTRSATPLGGKDFTFKKTTYQNYKGLESTCKVFDGTGIIKSRMYNINDTLYMISAGGKNINMEMVDKFLNSFRLKK